MKCRASERVVIIRTRRSLKLKEKKEQKKDLYGFFIRGGVMLCSFTHIYILLSIFVCCGCSLSPSLYFMLSLTKHLASYARLMASSLCASLRMTIFTVSRISFDNNAMTALIKICVPRGGLPILCTFARS